MANPSETVKFGGVTFRRYPDAKGWAERAYFTPGIADRTNGVRRLHEEIWMAHHGRQIPADHHIHHLDGNPLNNAPENLACLTEAEHAAHHTHERRGVCTPEARANLERIRPLASAWHRSPEGLAWHAENGRRVWEGRGSHAFTCQQCGSSGETRALHGGERFCSNACKSAWRRASGVDDEQRNCERCRSPFTVNKYSRTRFCGSSCARRDSLERRRARLESDRC
ncbi:HNH endonuclease signature motif containing protein [Streptomyces sp. NPDC060188]|uniref:HNH endonuclease signature motif containing protein n=1 Tax=Streptomyces sp. NPDC060188 TaxID=3347068 RepID=UPI00364EB2C1